MEPASGDGDVLWVDLVDAQKIHAEFPDSFPVPSREEIELAIQRGQYVKVCTGIERFWVKPTATRNGKHYGTVANLLVSMFPSFGDEIPFTWRNVYDIDS